MDSGKTTTAGYLTRGLRAAGKRVAYIKLTGTVYSKDKVFVEDCGATLSVDFSDCGFPSTFLCTLEELLDLYATLLNRVAQIDPDYLVMEIADGLLQRETDMLLRCLPFMNTIDHVILSCAGSLGVSSGIERLRAIGHPPVAISGSLTASPLLRDEVSGCTELPILGLEALADPDYLRPFLQTPVRAVAG